MKKDILSTNHSAINEVETHTNWAEANNNYVLMIRAILFSKIHVIVCMRSKTEYILEENERGKQVPKKVGMAPIVRDGIEYEFTTVFDLTSLIRPKQIKTGPNSLVILFSRLRKRSE